MIRSSQLAALSVLMLSTACAHEHKPMAATPVTGSERTAPPGAAPAVNAAPATTSTSAAAANPVQAEMQQLTAAMLTAVTGIAQGDVREVRHALHRVHGARAKTEAAIADGSYKAPKNADKMSRFVELDEAFHTQLEQLAAASKANDVPKTAQALGVAMQACNGCHSEFR